MTLLILRIVFLHFSGAFPITVYLRFILLLTLSLIKAGLVSLEATPPLSLDALEISKAGRLLMGTNLSGESNRFS